MNDLIRLLCAMIPCEADWAKVTYTAPHNPAAINDTEDRWWVSIEATYTAKPDPNDLKPVHVRAEVFTPRTAGTREMPSMEACVSALTLEAVVKARALCAKRRGELVAIEDAITAIPEAHRLPAKVDPSA